MINSFDEIDSAMISFIIACVFLIIIGIILSLFKSVKGTKTTLTNGIAGIGLLGIPIIIIAYLTFIGNNSTRNISEHFTSRSNTIRVETVKTSPYKTVYHNNEDVEVSIKKIPCDYVTLPALLHQVSIGNTLIDKDLKDFNQFTFSKNEAQSSRDRLTETVVAKDSPLTEDDTQAYKRIEKVEFANRTYRFSMNDYSVERTEPIARVTVSYQLDHKKAQEHADKNKIDKLIGKD